VSIGPEQAIRDAIGHDVLENESLDYLFSKVSDMIKEKASLTQQQQN
jgi:hypothetical protein